MSFAIPHLMRDLAILCHDTPVIANEVKQSKKETATT